MIQRMHLQPRAAGRARVRRASRILLSLAAMAALVSVDVPDAAAGQPLGVTARALPDATADRVGPLFAGGPDGGHFCTAAVVRSEDRDVIATAAHCLDNPDTTVFAPGYRDGVAPFGWWKVTGVYLAPGWTDGKDPDDDIAFATVAAVDGGRTGSVQDLVGASRSGPASRTTRRSRSSGTRAPWRRRCAAPTRPACSPRRSAGSAARI